MEKLRRKSIAIVTGASSGMGRDAVLQLADRFGVLEEIWVVARREERLQQLEKESPGRLRLSVAISSQSGELIPFAKALRKKNPAVRLLANAAGFGKDGPSSQIPV